MRACCYSDVYSIFQNKNSYKVVVLFSTQYCFDFEIDVDSLALFSSKTSRVIAAMKGVR